MNWRTQLVIRHLKFLFVVVICSNGQIIDTARHNDDVI